MRRTVLLAYFFVCSISLNMAYASESTEMSIFDDPYSAPSLNNLDFFQWFDLNLLAISHNLEAYSRYIDQYLGYTDEIQETFINNSHVKVLFNGEYSHLDHAQFRPTVKLKVHLPYINHRWKLLFHSIPEDTYFFQKKELYSQLKIKDPVQSSAALKIQGLSLFHYWDSDFKLGVKLKWPLDPFIKATFSRVEPLNPIWTGCFKQELFYYHSRGFGALSELNFYLYHESVSDKMLKFTSAARYFDRSSYWEWAQQMEWFQYLNMNNAVVYSVGTRFKITTDHFSAQDYWVTAAWKRRLYKNRIHLTVRPQLTFTKSHHFAVNPGLFVKLELFFSKNQTIDFLSFGVPLRKKDP